MKKYKRIFNEEKIDSQAFICNSEGVIEIIMGHEAHSAEVKKGDVFIIDSSFNKGEDTYRIYGYLILKVNTGFIHSPGFSGEETNLSKIVPHKNVVMAIQKTKITKKEDDFWATFSKV